MLFLPSERYNNFNTFANGAGCVRTGVQCAGPGRPDENNGAIKAERLRGEIEFRQVLLQ